MVIPIEYSEKLQFYGLQRYLKIGQFLKDVDREERMSLRMLLRQFISHSEMLYKRMPTWVHLHYVDKKEAQRIMKIIYVGVYGPHMNRTVLAKKITWQRCFQLTMEVDCVKFVKKCYNCQAYGDVSHLPLIELQGMILPQPFATWGINIMGEIRLMASNRHHYVIVAIVTSLSGWKQNLIRRQDQSRQ